MNKQKWMITFCLLTVATIPSSLSVFSDEYVEKTDALEEPSENNPKSVENFDKILELEPNNIKALYGKGSLLLLENDLDTSLRYFDRVLELEPEHVSSLVNKGIILGQKKQFDESLVLFDKALEIEPNNTNALTNKAVLFMTQKKNWQETIELLDKALEINPNHVQAFQNKKIAYATMPTKPFDGIIQTIARDKNGNLLGYLESDNIRATEYLPPSVLDKWISNSTKIVKENNDVLVFVKAVNGYNDNDSRMRTGLAISYMQEHQNEKLELPIILARQNGFFQETGDYFVSTWQLVVPKDLITK